jgi:hypothetical protein
MIIGIIDSDMPREAPRFNAQVALLTSSAPFDV